MLGQSFQWHAWCSDKQRLTTVRERHLQTRPLSGMMNVNNFLETQTRYHTDCFFFRNTQRHNWQMPECSSLKVMSMKGGGLVCFGEARHRVVCERVGWVGKGGGLGTILPGHCQPASQPCLSSGWAGIKVKRPSLE